MERFSYPNIAAVERESTRLMQMMEAESYGVIRDREEELEEQRRELENQQAQLRG